MIKKYLKNPDLNLDLKKKQKKLQIEGYRHLSRALKPPSFCLYNDDVASLEVHVRKTKAQLKSSTKN